MVAASSIQPRLISTFLGDCRFLPSHSAYSIHRLFRSNPGRDHVEMKMSRTFTGLTNLLFNRRSTDSERQRLRPGTVSPNRPVPSHIPKPPYVKSRKPPGIASGPEIHDEKGIECMRASGKLAAQVLMHAGTLVKASQQMKLTKQFIK